MHAMTFQLTTHPKAEVFTKKLVPKFLRGVGVGGESLPLSLLAFSLIVLIL